MRQHGVGKRRTWREIHLAVDEAARDIIGVEVTTAEWGDSEVFAALLDQVEVKISQVSADGAYDTEGTHAAIAERGAKATIPPREGAVPWGENHPRTFERQVNEVHVRAAIINQVTYLGMPDSVRAGKMTPDA